MIERNIYNQIIKNLNKEDIIVISGARQVGKTTILKFIKKDLETQDKKVYYFSFEDPLFISDINSHPENIFRYIPKNIKFKIYLLLDEIQYLKDPSNFLKYIYDYYKDNIKLIVTGSSAFYIDQKFKDSLTGRKRIFNIYPFSFSEFLKAKNEQYLSGIILNNNFFLKK